MEELKEAGRIFNKFVEACPNSAFTEKEMNQALIDWADKVKAKEALAGKPGVKVTADRVWIHKPDQHAFFGDHTTSIEYCPFNKDLRQGKVTIMQEDEGDKVVLTEPELDALYAECKKMFKELG
jgi:hypothetical protein